MLLCNTDETEETDATCNFFNANFINPSHVVYHIFDHRAIPSHVVSSISMNVFEPVGTIHTILCKLSFTEIAFILVPVTSP